MTKKTKKRIVIAIGVTAVLGIATYFGVKCYNEHRKNDWCGNPDDAMKRRMGGCDTVGTLKNILETCGHGISKAESKENEAEIKGALKGHDVDVKYYPPTKDGRCGHYRVEAKDNADLDAVKCIVEIVAKNLGFDVDDDSYNVLEIVDRGDVKK